MRERNRERECEREQSKWARGNWADKRERR